MADEKAIFPLLSTKLNRPPITGVHVPRLRLLERLNRRFQRPLTLISASAGYGKSILASSWLERCNYPNAWLSLDENDNDLRTFAAYFMASVRSIYSAVVGKVNSMSSANTLPSPNAIAHTLRYCCKHCDLLGDQVSLGFPWAYLWSRC